jgi:hypothetical protein
MGFPLQTYCEFLTTFAIHALEERSKEIGTVINDCGIRFTGCAIFYLRHLESTMS